MNKILLTVTAFTLLSNAAAQNLQKAIMVSADGQFLGTCEGRSSNYSLANPSSKYGSNTGFSSIFNQNNTYGKNFGDYSAMNKSANRPPYLIPYTRNDYDYFTLGKYQEDTDAVRERLAQSNYRRVTMNMFYLNTNKGITPAALRKECEKY